MGKALGDTAREGLTADWAVTADGGSWCARFWRLCCQHLYGSRYDGLYGPDAIATGRAFEAAGYAQGGAPCVGDGLFKLSGSGGFGHVGILVDGAVVAESSIVHNGRGTRSLSKFGQWDLVVRLPLVAGDAPWSLSIGGRRICTLFEARGSTWAPVRRVCEEAGVECGWDGANALAGGHALVVTLIAGKAYAQTRELAAACGLAVAVNGREVRLS